MDRTEEMRALWAKLNKILNGELTREDLTGADLVNLLDAVETAGGL